MPFGVSCPYEVAPILLPLHPTCLHQMEEPPALAWSAPEQGDISLVTEDNIFCVEVTD